MMTLEEARCILHPDTTWDNIRELTADGVAPAETIEQACLVACEAIDMVLASQWVPVSERLPEKDGKYLVVVAGDKIKEPYVLTWYFFDGRFEAFDYFPTRHITHWMPLPEPPKEDKYADH